MRFALVLLLAVMTLGSVAWARADDMQKPQRFKRTLKRKLDAHYLLYLPADYSQDRAKRWPLMLFLHGAGERGTNLQKVAVHGPPRMLRSRTDFPFIVVSPQCPTDQLWNNDTLLGLLDEVIKRHRVDTNRVYLTGLSMGGYGTWSLALQYPERFAAVAPICGGGSTIEVMLASRSKTAALRRLPFWIFHGAKDPLVPLSESERMVDVLKRAGVREVELTVYPEATHDSWTETYANEKLYEWFLQHPR